MRSLHILALFPLTALAALNGRCSGSKATGAYGDSGICIHTSTCNQYNGVYKSGACPNDAEDVKCCVVGLAGSASIDPCGGVSWCDWTSISCAGQRISGHCPGGSNFKCCLV